MTIFKWDEKYSVGIQSIDDQHKEIFRLLDQLFQGLKSGKVSESVMEIIRDLENYAVIHFNYEESFFRQFNFESESEHIKEHQQFIEKIASVKADVIAGKLQSPFELLRYLKVWVDHHVLVVDMEYSDLFRKNGLR